MDSLIRQIVDAHLGIRPQVRTTPLELSAPLSLMNGCEVFLKCEHVQHTGSFKYRGAVNKVRLLSNEERENGVITASTGNHGQALALAARAFGVPVTVFAPTTAAKVKLDAIRTFGAQVELVEGGALEAEKAAAERAAAQNTLFISPYNDLDIIAGQGTVGAELAEQAPDLDAVFVAVGGGGLISGVGSIVKKMSPKTQIIGCWPENSPAMYASLQAGEIVDAPEFDTLSDGTAGGIEPGSITFPLCQQLIDRCVLVSELEIRRAMRLLADTDRWMVEGAAGVALAAALRLMPEFKGRRIAVVLCGRNIVLDKYLQAISEA